MILEALRVRNYRSIADEILHCGQLTALVGANGAGKSSFLRALEIFYSLTPKVDAEDFHAGDVSTEISVAVTYRLISNAAKELFSKYSQDGELTVERVITWNEGKCISKYHGSTLQNPAFSALRQAFLLKDRAKTAKQIYDALRAQPEYAKLSEWSTIGETEDILKEWEATNPDKCVRQRDDGQFFGFKEVGQGYLGRFTRLLYIPAVRDASDDASEGRGSVLTSLMDLVVRSALANTEALRQLKEETQKQYKNLLDPTTMPELGVLSEKLTATLKAFVTDARVDLAWLPLGEIEIPLPRADVKLIEDGYLSAVGRTGHGLQRAFIMTMLQHLAVAQIPTTQPASGSDGEDSPSIPNLILAIEEPELYQHPSRQRHFARILSSLASGAIPGVANATQIIYGTHSPLFVSVSRIDQVRALRKVHVQPDKPKVTRIVKTTLDEVAELIWEADGKQGTKYTSATLQPRLQTILTPWMNEGFFSDLVVLVEGEDDRAAILGMAVSMKHDFDGEGISVIPCSGKTNIDKPLAIFRSLGIKVYPIWDGDKCDNEAKPEDNHRLLRLLKRDVEDWPVGVFDQFACFEDNLDVVIRREIGSANFDICLAESQTEYSIPKRKHALKNPAVVGTVILKAQMSGHTSPTLKAIVEKIILLRST